MAATYKVNVIEKVYRSCNTKHNISQHFLESDFKLDIHAWSNPLPLNETIFWEHEVFVDCCHSNTAIYIFPVFFFKKFENNGKITVFVNILK